MQPEKGGMMIDQSELQMINVLDRTNKPRQRPKYQITSIKMDEQPVTANFGHYRPDSKLAAQKLMSFDTLKDFNFKD